MGTYGPNFDFRVVPEEESRRGRIILANGADVPIGSPLKIADGATPSTVFTGALPAALATGSQAPKRGFCGIGLYEWIDLNGLDPLYNTYSNRSTIPDGKLCQLIANPGAKVVFRNTAASVFLGLRSDAGRTMVAGMGATPTVTVGSMLTPGTGDDTSGYWAVTTTAANAWLIVTRVDAVRHEVEAELNF